MKHSLPTVVSKMSGPIESKPKRGFSLENAKIMPPVRSSSSVESPLAKEELLIKMYASLNDPSWLILEEIGKGSNKRSLITINDGREFRDTKKSKADGSWTATATLESSLIQIEGGTGAILNNNNDNEENDSEPDPDEEDNLYEDVQLSLIHISEPTRPTT